MNNKDTNIVNSLKEKIYTLIDINEKLKKDKTQLKEHNKNLESQLKQVKTELDNCKEKYTRLEIAKSLQSSSANHDAKIKINRIVREIDNCIALLNK